MVQAPPLVGTMAVIGVGLIGGSLALALRQAGAVGRVIGVGRSRANLDVALERGLIDTAYTSGEAWAPFAGTADLVLVATPVAQIPAVLGELAPHLAPGTVVSDAGSTKARVVVEARAAMGDRFRRFVPGHPIAGTERSGAEAAFAELYAERNVVLCPQPQTDSDAIALVRSAWQAAGAHVQEMEAAQHDRVLAAVSHLPHLLAFGLVAELAARPEADAYFHYAASGFRDFTRIASSHPEMWRDICLANGEALLAEIDAYQRELQALRAALAAGDGDALVERFRLAREARNAWLARRAR